MWRNLLGAAAVLLTTPGVAYAGEFPGLVETIIAALVGIALVLGLFTEGLLALLKSRPLRWQRGLCYAALWLVGLFVLLWLRRT